MSLYRNAVWFLKGWQEYTKGGYQTAAQKFTSQDLDVDCCGKVFMITGANSGIGKCVTLEIAKRGGTVHMVCRNSESADAVKDEIVKTTQNENIHTHILDLSQPRSVYKFATNFKETQERLDVLINNAGCMVNKRETDEDGLEKNFATNTLGTHILTRVLLPLLKKTEKSRVVTVSSGGLLVQKLNPDDLQFEKMSPFDGTMAYAQNKRQQVVMTEYFARENPEVFFATMHPGWADTPAVRSSMPDFYNKMKDRLRTAEQGADTVVWLAISEAAIKHPSGLFFQDRTPVPTHLPLAWTKTSKEEEEKFMKQLEELLEKFRS
ncbi:dehydrogenase/reductase SDR family member 12-like isoform X2 [Schistocerca nitens]|nr:dehydrogenase/reductase SDR family member 12-like isoform X2 [Schistocerca nitens]XP_049802109.1 dehydrogenase/reductase SDR family member 12-like isoform X2 [Schistocerca nitens]XP_049802110.1 dehydrogenase/reductase SDR family member 12-like isoform X2 [Schistocerca nitens]